MKPTRLVVAYWADTELAFLEFARELSAKNGSAFVFIKIRHHDSWFSQNRSILTNMFHVSKIFIKILISGFGGRVVSFGTNTSRILFFCSWLFSDTYFVYNELPAISRWSFLALVDRLIFRFARNVNVSTLERAKFILQRYGLSRSIDVLENISFAEIPELTSNTRTGGLLFAGSITAKRFDKNDIKKMVEIVDRFGRKIDAYGEVAGSIPDGFNSLIVFHDKVDHSRMLQLMLEYEYGILSYYTGEPNYDLCAPLKLYEYLAYGCKIISLNRNQGLLELAKRYPSLISFLSEDGELTLLSGVTQSGFHSQREQFLSEAISSNRRFCERIVPRRLD